MSMIPTIQDKRPPFVRFEEREMGIDPVASEKAGRPVPKLVFMALITPHHSKDVVEKIAEEWLGQIKKKALNGEYPVEWFNHFDLQYSEWRKGNELPREGTPVKTWAMATREISTRLIASGITTVEDLAEMPDSNLGAVGLDGRYWRDLAKGWINEAKDKGVNAKAIADANIKIVGLEEKLAQQSVMLERMRARLDAAEERESEAPQRRGKRNEAA